MRLVFLLSVGMVLFGCNNSTNKNIVVTDSSICDSANQLIVDRKPGDSLASNTFDATDSSQDYRRYVVKAFQSRSFINVSDNAVVFVYPDSLQIGTMKRLQGDTNFFIMADDANWYMSQAHQFIETQNIKSIDADKRYIRFSSKSNPIILDTRASMSTGWMIIFYRKDSAPKIVSSVTIEQEFDDYFGRDKR